MEEYNFKNNHHPRRSGFIWGIILMIAGLLFLSFNLGWLDSSYQQVIFSWQMLLIVIGLLNYYWRHFFSGTVFLLIGAFFLLPRLALASSETFWWVAPDFTQNYWAILLVVGGILLILQWIFHPKPNIHNHIGSSEYNKKKRIREGADIHCTGIERNSVFANLEEIILDPVFTGGEMNAVFGGITLDLRKTSLAEGETVIELNAVFGGITIFVPEDWNVELHLTSVFGGFMDKRVMKGGVDNPRKLVIVGSCVFGGGEIKN